MNFAVLVGAIIGLSTNGLLSDWIAARATKRNGGVREPEMRLPAMIPYVIIMLIGNFVVAFGYERKWNWQVCFLSFPDCLYRYLLSATDNRNSRLHLRGHPSRGLTRHYIHLRRRQLQASCRQHLRGDYGQQERLGIWLQQIHHALDHC